MVPGYHTDATSEFHYRFDGDLTDSGPGAVYGTLSAGYLEAPYRGTNSCGRLATQNHGTSVSGHPMKTGGSVTIAAWLWLQSNPSQNVSLCGVRGGGSSGNPDAFNFCWELGVTTAGYLRFFWQYDAKLLGGLEGVIGAAIPKDRWVHCMGTRNAAGTECEIYIDGVDVGSATGQTAWNGGGSMNTLTFGHNGSAELTGYIASVYGDLAHTTDADAFYTAAKQAV